MKRRSELWRLRVLALLSVVVAAVAVAGCGGSSDAASGGSSSASSSGSSGASSPSTKLNLVGYSTPKKAYDALTTAFAQTSAATTSRRFPANFAGQRPFIAARHRAAKSQVP